ncbi:U5 ASSOCIATED snRNP [Encephalitozoon cuniculi GB-M1]|uniref:Probable ethanolamine-phosphate cytidylyltransferase n=1 Tax=Encephalitozoon cuniculi (strain GB-M1) TaxID=284813 RepID=ECT1_ENCCU|nr:ethanolamine-phosphate cytidylyltransferase [Encephalitozoon cuniculi GB-M1]Q8SQW6.1 RecName: Full=Probable ethanolamine-phosphate cytidylyltransferase; AltName: Full=CTP:phosphoethanolamine cytidylyltransferase; AltName: Full=Phosphorylethanolamine transferase [Encephalitozoon cuniculi GB-M1]KMV65045.1 putative ethanolamine-phosphatecytidylytransferase [Encephalitozoon cuniculi EcunIII-L]UYI26290.1 ethanolamine-phosphate cytidylyltransferase [Encephalitozoon cuniculi]CAD25997.1 U5 ASSOCIATE
MASHEIQKVWADGCFDMFHYGHANALRQSKALGDYLIAGVHSSLSINQEKGLPVMEDEERYEVVEGCRYVDEVVRDAPFVTQTSMIKEYGVSIVAHGNDIVLDSSGQDSYCQVRRMGIFREVERTFGISTTEIVGRMMLKNRGSWLDGENGESSKDSGYHDRLLSLFMSSMGREKRGKVVFMDGNFDLFHAGHVASLRIARGMGDYLIVGIHDDETTKEYTRSYPVLSTKERMLTLMACRYVDEIVVSPYLVGSEFIKRHGIDVVAPSFDSKDLSRYDGIKDVVEHSYAENRFNYLSAEHIVNRIISNYQDYANRQKKRTGK